MPQNDTNAGDSQNDINRERAWNRLVRNVIWFLVNPFGIILGILFLWMALHFISWRAAILSLTTGVLVIYGAAIFLGLEIFLMNAIYVPIYNQLTQSTLRPIVIQTTGFGDFDN